ncbi:uncharacterized protein H6S33_009466 [Morchella sextelata]|uniref:uncharacterized protein n=1 Tax=Morchella sextelata TaxID=1174677 RepID=UPI001D04C2D2|nr:uncharacterized protein H6S33_009466 [Morchella sextelata]KAH0613086.1 hypothetical protein H6S33_009466 [Morchella sextelata]
MSSFLRHLTRVSAGVTFLSLIILLIPLAFDVGGRDCGLTYSLSLTIFYFLLSTTRMITPNSPCWRGMRMRVLLSVVGVAQHLVIIPGLLIYALNKFSDNEGNGGKSAGYVHDESWNPSWVDKLSIVPWDNFLTFSTPVFQLCEGFCSLLVIQAVGQISRWLVNRNKSDSWMIALLVMSGSVISSSVYFLWRITTFPEIGNIDASLIGVAVTCAIFLCAYGIGSGRGNPIESSLLFSYIVLCLYQIFTDYKPSSLDTADAIPPGKPDFPPFPPLIMASYSSIVASMSSYLPGFLRQIASFGISAVATITPSVVISLAYRLFVFYASTRIIPAVRDENSASVRGGEAMSRILGWYSPCILVSVYTHLLMQHLEIAGGDAGVGAGSWEGGMPAGGQVWRWVNIGATMVLYAFELKHGDNDGGESLTSHWKTD